MNWEALYTIKFEVIRAFTMFEEYHHFGIKPWETQNYVTGRRDYYIEDLNVLKQMSRLQKIFEKKT